jgi:hypothetical protein
MSPTGLGLLCALLSDMFSHGRPHRAANDY